MLQFAPRQSSCSDLTGNSFLSAIDRVAAGGYIPSTGERCNSPYFIRSPIARR
jgi:hypothetical protein